MTSIRDPGGDWRVARNGRFVGEIPSDAPCLRDRRR